MRYYALACDYDGTLALHGHVDDAILAALERVRGSRRKLILVTGRQLPDLLRVFPRTDLFDYVVAENGALLYRPSDRTEQALGESPSETFVAALRQRGVAPLSQGRVIVATWEPNETAVLEVIRDRLPRAAGGAGLSVLHHRSRGRLRELRGRRRTRRRQPGPAGQGGHRGT